MSAENKRLPIIGAGGGGKDGGGGASSPTEAPDSIRSRAYAHVLDLISEGEIEGLVNGARGIYLDETPLQSADGTYNFRGVKVSSRNGTQSQTYIPGFSSVENETQVGVESLKATPVVRTITNADVDAVRITIGFPQLLEQISSGDIVGTSVQYAIDLQSNGGGYVAQRVGYEFSQGTIRVDGTAVAPGASTAIRGVISWTRPTVIAGSNDFGDYYGQASASVAVEYRTNGVGAWTTMRTLLLSGNADGQTVTAGTQTLWAESNDFSFSADELASATYEVRAVLTGDGSAEISAAEFYAPTTTITLTGKASSKYQRSHRIELTGDAPWDIRLRRITDDAARTSLQNRTIWDSYTEIIDTKLRYPNSAVVGITIDSTQFRQIPRRGYDVKLLKVQIPSNYDPTDRSYTGVWDGTFTTAWSDNPAWCFFDLLTNSRYGLGGFIDASQVDKWALYRIAQYCDEMVENGLGGTEPRFTCNLYLQSREDAYKVMQDIASCFRGMTYWASGAITAVQDAPADTTHLYSPSNVIDGLFTYSGSSARARHTVALVSWNDPADFYRQKVEYVEDSEGIARYGIVETSVIAVGCTSRAQANRAGRWLLYSERLESETVTFRVGMDSAMCRPGAVVQVADPVRAGERRGGRVVSASTTVVELDDTVTLASGPYTLSIHEPSGAVQERTVINSLGDTDALSVLPAFDVAPATNAIWLLSSADLEPQTFRVISVVEAERNVFEIVALSHNVSKYDAIESDMSLQQPDISNLKEVPDAPGTLTLTESLYEFQNQIRTLVDLSWQPVSGVFSYTVWWRRDSGNWVITENLPSPEFSLQDAQPGDYEFRVWSVSPLGRKSGEAAELDETVYGKTLPPSDVTAFTALQNNTVVLFRWSQIADVDLAGYEIRYTTQTIGALGAATAWDAGTVVTSATRGTQITTAAVPPGAWTFLIKAIDTSGIYSENAKTYDADITQLTTFQEIHSQTESPAWRNWRSNDGAAMWDPDPTDAMWDRGEATAIPYWSADSATGMWDADSGTLMWDGSTRMWFQSNFYRHWTGVLVPKSQDFASIGDWDTFDEFVPNPYEVCIYQGDKIDQSFDALARVYSVIGSVAGPGETGTPDVDFYIDWRTDAGTFDGYELWGVGEITGRYVRPRIVHNTAGGVARITDFTVTLDADEGVQNGAAVAVSASGTAIVFSPAYHNAPRLQVSAQSAAGAGRFATFESLTATGFTARVFDAAGTDVGGTINWDAAGV